MRKIDIVTPTFRLEVPLIELQVKSIVKYLDPNILNKYWVIWNDDSDFGNVKDRILAAGMSKIDIEFIDFKAIHSANIHGWRSQQLIKLLASKIVQEKNYLVLDSKNHLIRDVACDDFFSPAGKIKSYLHLVGPALKAHLSSSLAYFSQNINIDRDQVMQTTTPFVFDRDLVIELLSSDNFLKDFEKPDSLLTEFFSYYAFLKSKDIDENLYEYVPQMNATFFAGMPDIDNSFVRNTMNSVNEDRIKFLGFHRSNFHKNCNEQFKSWAFSRWIQFGLMKDIQECNMLWQSMLDLQD